MEVIKNFGLDPLLLGAQIVNFLIILYILKRFLYKPVLELLKKREQTIKEGLLQAEEGKKLYEDAKISERNILKNAQTQAQKILDDAKVQALEISKETEETARRRSDEIIANAKEKINREIKDAQKQLAFRVGEIAINFIEKSAKELFGEKEQEKLVKTALSKFKRAD